MLCGMPFSWLISVMVNGWLARAARQSRSKCRLFATMRSAEPLGVHVAICFSDDADVPEEQAAPRSARPAKTHSRAVETARCRMTGLVPVLQDGGHLGLAEAPELA